MKRMSALVITLLTILVFTQSALSATTQDFSKALETLSDDFSVASTWINNQLAKSIAFGASGTIQRPAAVKTLPGFEIGITGGLSVAIDESALVDIDTYAISSDFLNLPAFFFSQTGMIHGKIGLVKLPAVGKIDIGAGFSNYGLNYSDDFDGQFSQWQLEGRIQPELPVPFDLSLSLGVGNMKGNYRVQNGHTEELNSIEYNGNIYTQTLDTVVFMSSDWDMTAYYAKIIISQNLIFVTPYAGIGLQTTTGAVNTIVGSTGTISLDPDLPGPIESESLTVTGPAGTTAGSFDFKLLGGVQFNLFPMVSLNISGEYGNNVYAASLGLIIGLL
ncbi:hypothetical protein K8S19_06470 [bacterium]|nr:hypothetical protein [bacterium]